MRIYLSRNRLLSFRTLFLILTYLNASLILFPFYTSMDGPSHVYNSNLLKEILLQDNHFVKQFFTLNNDIVPNLTSHVILLILSAVFSSTVSQKLFLLFIAIALPLTIYKLIKRIAPGNVFFALMALPFVYSYFMGLGFYNFSLGVILLFFVIDYWMKRENRKSIKSFILLFVLITLTYLTHPVIFLISFFSIGLYSFLNILQELKNRKPYWESVKEISVLIIVSLPSLLLFYRYLSKWEISDLSNKLSFSKLSVWLIDVRSLIIHNYSREVPFSRLLFLFAFIFLVHIIYSTFLKRTVKNTNFRFNNARSFFSIICLGILGLYFIFPDSSSGGSYISLRLNLIFFLFLSVWLATFHYPANLLKINFFILLTSTTGLFVRNYIVLKSYGHRVNSFKTMDTHMQENAVLLPFNCSGKLMDKHFPHYMGWNKPVVILENYEASTGYFPVVWNKDELPSLMAGDSIYSEVCLYEKFPVISKTSKKIDYIVVWGNREMTTCQSALWNNLIVHFELIYHDDLSNTRLYKIK